MEMLQPQLGEGFYAPGSGLDGINPQLWRGCVAAYAPCLGRQGNTLYDFSGYGNHGTLGFMDPSTDYVFAMLNGQIFTALEFDGSDDRVDIDHIPITYDETITISCVIKANENSGSDSKHIVSMQKRTSPFTGYHLGLKSNTFNWEYLGASGWCIAQIPSTQLSDGKYHTVSLTMSEATVTKFSVDGDLKTITLVADNLAASYSTIVNAYIGARDTLRGPEFFGGSIASLAFYRSDCDHAAIHRHGPLGPYQYRTPEYPCLAVEGGFKPAWAVQRQSKFIGGGVL